MCVYIYIYIHIYIYNLACLWIDVALDSRVLGGQPNPLLPGLYQGSSTRRFSSGMVATCLHRLADLPFVSQLGLGMIELDSPEASVEL